MRKLFPFLLFLAAAAALAQNPPYAPDRRPGEGEGPFQRLIIRGATVIDGTGAPPIGPADVVIEGNRIREIRVVGAPLVPIKPEGRPTGATKEPDERAGEVVGALLATLVIASLDNGMSLPSVENAP